LARILIARNKSLCVELISNPTDWQKGRAQEYINSRIGRGYGVSGAASSVLGGWLFKAFKAFLKFFGKDLDKKKEDYCSQVSIKPFFASFIVVEPKDTQISPSEAIKLIEASGKFKPRRRLR
jgi:hypothetical protein